MKERPESYDAYPFFLFIIFLNIFRYSDHVAEVFFLQTNGNMMDYTVWRKKPQTPEFTNFLKAHRLDPPAETGVQSKPVKYLFLSFVFLLSE